MTNASGIHPVGHRILVLPDEVEHKTASGIVLATASQQQREEMAQVDGVLVAVGDNAWADQLAPFAKVGQRVMFGKYTGIVRVGKDEKKYRVLSDLDVVAVIEG